MWRGMDQRCGGSLCVKDIEKPESQIKTQEQRREKDKQLVM